MVFIILILFRWAFLGLLTDGGKGGGKKALSLKSVTHAAIMKLGTVIPNLKKIQKDMNHVTHPLSSPGISIFSPEIGRFCYIKKYRYRFHIDT